jgi:hypothetical protein
VTRSIPPILSRAAFVDTRTGVLTREGMLVLDALRSALGGDAATVTPVEPLGALTPVAAPIMALDLLWPVAGAVSAQDGLAPVSGPMVTADNFAPVCGCDMAGGLDPVAPIGPEALP